MRPMLKYLTAACTAAMLLACADAVQRHANPLVSAQAMADEAYAIARSQHLALRFADADTSYRAALAAMPGHVPTRNGMAALKAEQGDLDGAIALWQDLATTEAGEAGAANAYLFSNLGHAYFLKGDNKAALAALEKACVLDPLNHRAWQRLSAVLDKAGQKARAARMARQAATLRSHDFSADYAVAERGGVAAIDVAVKSAEQDGQSWDRVDVREQEAGVFVLSRIRADQVRAAAAPFDLPGAALENRITIGADGMATLEIRNGNGINGAARALAGKMGDPSLRVVRLSNHKGYGVQRTRVEYRPAYRAAAEKLAARVGTIRVVAAGAAGPGAADLRLIIGRDLRAPTAGPALPAAQKAAPPAAPALALRQKEPPKSS